MTIKVKVNAAAVLVALVASPALAQTDDPSGPRARPGGGSIPAQIQSLRDADAQLQGNIDAEAAARAGADAALQGDIAAETAARAAADAALGGNIDAVAADLAAEAAVRAAADTALQSDIAAETAARAAADAALGGNIDAVATDLAAEAAARAAADAVLQGSIDAIVLTPGPAGPPGAAGDGTVIRVLAPPSRADGNHKPGQTLYEVVNVCGGSGEAIEAGVLDNPNSPGRISAGVVNFRPLDLDVQFQVTRIDSSVQIGDIINADVEFFVRCIEFSAVVVATPIVSPTKTVFVTSRVFTGDLGGIAGADAKCQAAADDPASIVPSGTYLAWISDSVEGPLSRFTRSSFPYVLPDGTVVARNFDALIGGSLESPISLTEKGLILELPPGRTFIRANTGTQPTGDLVLDNKVGVCPTTPRTCEDWTDGSTLGCSAAGDPFATATPSWSNDGVPYTCVAKAALYCFQQ